VAPGFESSGTGMRTMVTKIEFGKREDARKIRKDPLYSSFLADRDDGRESTVYLLDSTPENALSDIRGEAAESRQFKRQQAGQMSLTDDERRRIDFSKDGVNVPKARSIKAIAANEGVDDWTAFADLELTVDENRSVLKRAKRQERGQRMDAVTEDAFDIDREARAYQREKREGFGHMIKGAFGGSEEAQKRVREAGLGELDIGFTLTESGSLRGSGRDFERLQDIHEGRSNRAQRVDERRQASQVTRDPFVWAQNPSTYDYPGVDTVDPQTLHEQRSHKAQRVDERNFAPVTDDKEKWAQNQDEYDYDGVDTPPDLPEWARGTLSADQDTNSFSLDSRDRGAAFPEWEAGVDVGDAVRSAEMTGRDVSASPGEVFGGVGATSSREIGGFVPDVGETDRLKREEAPPDLAAEGFEFSISDGSHEDGFEDLL